MNANSVSTVKIGFNHGAGRAKTRRKSGKAITLVLLVFVFVSKLLGVCSPTEAFEASFATKSTLQILWNMATIAQAMEAAISQVTSTRMRDGNVVSLADARKRALQSQVKFDRRELDQILRVYSFMVAGSDWRDYAIDHLSDKAVFSVFRRTSEMPLFRIEKDPKRAQKQGAYSVITAAGKVIKRGQDLGQVLKVFDKAIKLVQSD